MPSEGLHCHVLPQVRRLPQDGSNNPERRVLGRGRVEAEGKVPEPTGGPGGCRQNTTAQREGMGENRKRKNKRAEREKERVSNKQAGKEPNSRVSAREKQSNEV